MIKEFNIPKAIYLHNEGIKDLDFRQIKGFLKENFGHLKVYLTQLKKKVVSTSGLLFDFIETQKNFETLEYSPAVAGSRLKLDDWREKLKDTCHIILTQKLFATVDADKRPHIRAAIFGFPSVISTSGIVEGPAKPKEYYLYKQKYTQLGIWEIEEPRIKRRFKQRFIDYQDKRLTEVIKGYIAQGMFFYITGEPFCKNKTCRLFNAHWQADLIFAQIKSGKFCPRHKKILRHIAT